MAVILFPPSLVSLTQRANIPNPCPFLQRINERALENFQLYNEMYQRAQRDDLTWIGGLWLPIATATGIGIGGGLGYFLTAPLITKALEVLAFGVVPFPLKVVLYAATCAHHVSRSTSILSMFALQYHHHQDRALSRIWTLEVGFMREINRELGEEKSRLRDELGGNLNDAQRSTLSSQLEQVSSFAESIIGGYVDSARTDSDLPGLAEMHLNFTEINEINLRVLYTGLVG